MFRKMELLGAVGRRRRLIVGGLLLRGCGARRQQDRRADQERARGIQSESSCHDSKIPLICSPLPVVAVYPGPLNAALAANPFQCQVNPEGVPGAEVSDLLEIALPADPDLDAIVFVLDPESVADGLPSVGS